MAMWPSSCIPDSRGKRRQKELPAGQHDGAGEHQARGLRTYGCIQDADAQREALTPLPATRKTG